MLRELAPHMGTINKFFVFLHAVILYTFYVMSKIVQ